MIYVLVVVFLNVVATLFKWIEKKSIRLDLLVFFSRLEMLLSYFLGSSISP
jgi:hypothetical protein